MRAIAILLACVACAGHAHKVQATSSQMYEIANAERQSLKDDMKALSMLLFSFNPAPVSHSPSQAFNRGVKNPAIHRVPSRHADASMFFGGGGKSDDSRTLADFTAKDIKGNLVSLKDFVGKVVLIVNVASA
mmetsp:Transcript_154808/g.288598  ORF Transcript_154808/g.288598 Transcript_154808/m.288598 type:complete len:132 (-) Transcript_154808:422-817(-)